MISRIRRFFSSNLKLKGMALALALLSWYIVNKITNYDKTISNLSLEVNLPDGWAVLGKSTDDFQVIFRGTKEDLLLLDDRTVELSVDLSDESLDPNQYETFLPVRLTPRNVNHNSKARVAEINPPDLEVRVVLEGQKQLPLRVNLTGEAVLGLQVETIATEPQRVTLFGARERLEPITALQTSPLNLSDRVGSFEQRVDVLPPTPDWVGRVEPARVTVRVTLVGLTEDRRFSNIPIRLYRDPASGPGPDLLPNPALVEVLLQGSPELLDSISTSDIRAFAEATNANGRSPVVVNVPPGLDVLDISPSEVRMRLRPEPAPTPPPEPQLQPLPMSTEDTP